MHIPFSPKITIEEAKRIRKLNAMRKAKHLNSRIIMFINDINNTKLNKTDKTEIINTVTQKLNEYK